MPHRGGKDGAKIDAPAASLWLVNPDGSGDASTIQAAVDASASGDTILLGEGVFTGPGNRHVLIATPRVLRSVAGPENTIIDCEGMDSGIALGEYYSVTRSPRDARPRGAAARGEPATATEEEFVIDGITIRNAGTGVWQSYAIHGEYVSWTLNNSIISATGGTGVDLWGGNVRMHDTVVEGSTASGVSLIFAGLVATDCVLRDNWIGVNSGGFAMLTRCVLEGNGMFAVNGLEDELVLTECDISGNGHGNVFGGVLVQADGSASITGCYIHHNFGRRIAELSTVGDGLLLQDNVIVHNEGAIHFDGEPFVRPDEARARIVGNTIIGNGGSGRPLIQASHAEVVLERNIIAFNTVSPLLDQWDEADVTWTHNDFFANAGAVPTPLGADGNFSADPWFCNRFAGEYTLQDGSTCLPENNPDGVLVGALSQGCTALAPELVLAPPVLSGPLHGTLKATLTRGDGIDVDDIDAATIRLGGVLSPALDTDGNDDAGSKHRLKLHFEKADVVALLAPVAGGDTRRVWLTAQTHDGDPVRAVADIRIGHIDGVTNTEPGGDPGPSPEPDTPHRATPGIATVTPNPFNPVATIRFGVVNEGIVDLAVYDVAGRLVARLVHESMPAGNHDVTWDAGGVASGVYFARLTTPDGTFTRKLVVTK